MKKFNVFLLIGLILVWIVAIATPGTTQSGNQSDVTGPSPTFTDSPGATQSGNQSDVTGPDPTFPDYPRIPEIPQIDRPAYESQLQQADANLAVSLIEEYQKTQFCSYLRLKVCGQEPSPGQIVQRLSEIWQETQQKSAFVYVSSLADELRLLMVFPLAPSTVNNTSENIPQFEGLVIREKVAVTRTKLLETVQAFQDFVQDPYSPENDYREPAKVLYQWIIAPLEAKLQANGIEPIEIDNLIFVMDSGLRTIPLAALYDGKNHLVERYGIAIVPSFGLTDVGYSGDRQVPILAMGASEFSGLPIVKSLPTVPVRLQVITSSPQQGKTFVNPDFTVANFTKENKQGQFGIIHLATHGKFEPGGLENSFIRFYNQTINLNQLGQIAEELGWSTSETASIELLVLDACETAVDDQGEDSVELGFSGLAVKAGVKSALASLWKVDEVATLALMSEFYDQLSRNPIKAQALRKAQIEMLKGDIGIEEGKVKLSNGKIIELPSGVEIPINFKHPAFWSAFMLIGNWN